jgi:hypothetical protein
VPRSRRRRRPARFRRDSKRSAQAWLRLYRRDATLDCHAVELREVR